MSSQHPRSNGGGRHPKHPIYDPNERRDSDVGNTNDYHAMDIQQLEAHRDDEMSRQDAALDNIYDGVKNLKGQAHAINGEVVEQNAMIDDVGNRMDNAHEDLVREEEHARQVNKNNKHACKLYVVIVVEVAILIVVFLV